MYWLNTGRGRVPWYTGDTIKRLLAKTIVEDVRGKLERLGDHYRGYSYNACEGEVYTPFLLNLYSLTLSNSITYILLYYSNF